MSQTLAAPCKEVSLQGRQANLSGRAAEDMIYCILKERGYRVVRQCPLGTNIYGHNMKVDFWVLGIPMFPDGLIIESRWQEVAGSADEKFPYLVWNIMTCYPFPTMVVYGGGGSRTGAILWLQAQVGGNFYAAFTLEEFLKWVIRNA